MSEISPSMSLIVHAGIGRAEADAVGGERLAGDRTVAALDQEQGALVGIDQIQAPAIGIVDAGGAEPPKKARSVARNSWPFTRTPPWLMRIVMPLSEARFRRCWPRSRPRTGRGCAGR
ncbi:MAG: hypothetical protein U1E17_15910 [Geminicoccaceae bacterium]